MEVWTATASEDEPLYVCQCGWERCQPRHQVNPCVRDHYLIHFVASGRGAFWSENVRYSLSAGMGFIIFPAQVTGYRADEGEPWTYGWVGYSGRDAAMLTCEVGLTRESPVFSLDDIDASFLLLKAMERDASALRMGRLVALGRLYEFLALIGQTRMPQKNSASEQYFRKALWYMEGNVDRPIRVTDVARFVGLSRSQLFRVFQREAGVSPLEALSDVRLARAKYFLERTQLALEQIACAVGMSSRARLCALFKRKYGLSAGQYRRACEEKSAQGD